MCVSGVSNLTRLIESVNGVESLTHMQQKDNQTNENAQDEKESEEKRKSKSVGIPHLMLIVRGILNCCYISSRMCLYTVHIVCEEDEHYTRNNNINNKTKIVCKKPQQNSVD